MFWMAALAALVGCATLGTPPGEANQKVAVRALWVSTQCGGVGEAPSWVWVEGSAALAASLQPSPERVPGGSAPALPEVDFAHERVLRLDMGRRPTAGYALGLLTGEAAVTDGLATLRIEWREPEPGRLQAQVVTQPCLVLALPRGEHGALRVLDQAGRERFRAEVPR